MESELQKEKERMRCEIDTKRSDLVAFKTHNYANFEKNSKYESLKFDSEVDDDQADV